MALKGKSTRTNRKMNSLAQIALNFAFSLNNSNFPTLLDIRDHTNGTLSDRKFLAKALNVGNEIWFHVAEGCACS